MKKAKHYRFLYRIKSEKTLVGLLIVLAKVVFFLIQVVFFIIKRT